MSFVAPDPHQHTGRPHGNGHCVALVRHASGAPVTTTWRRGDPVQGSGAAPGTAIATFDRNGRYANATDGSSHAAILLAENTDGSLEVIDQWVGRNAQVRTIRDKRGAGPAADDASRFYIIETA
jgi:hypothetical protein